MKIILSLSMVLFFNCIFSQTNNVVPKSIHNFNVQDIYGNGFDFKSLKGKKEMEKWIQKDVESHKRHHGKNT